MKKVIAIFAVVFVAGILAGGVYEGLSNGGIKAVWPFKTDAAAAAVKAKIQPEPPPESAAEAQTPEKTGVAQDQHLVTNPNKVCATPDCGGAVFVTYKDQVLCVKCYGEAKNRDTGHK